MFSNINKYLRILNSDEPVVFTLNLFTQLKYYS